MPHPRPTFRSIHWLVLVVLLIERFSVFADPISALSPPAYISVGIGNPSLSGSVSVVNDGFDAQGSGTDIGGSADQFQFAYQQRTGDFDVRVRVQSLDQVNAWTKAGLMARATLDPSSAFTSVLTTPSLPGSFFEYRSASGVKTSLSGGVPGNHPATWLRLQRSGNNFFGFASFDGAIWTQLGSISVTMARTIYFGLAVCSHESNRLANAQFRDLTNGVGGAIGPVTLPTEPLGACTRKTGFVISEIMYQPAPRSDGKILEFIELFNSNPFFEDISGYRLAGQIDFTFPKGTVLPGGAFLVVAAAPVDIQNYYSLTNVLGPYHNSLKTKKGSGLVQLLDGIGSVLLEIPYSSSRPWPIGAAGTGHSLILARPSYGEADPKAWAISDVIGGSPGMVDAYRPSPLRAVVINEFLARPNEAGAGFVELYNHANESVDLSGCSLSDDAVAARFIIPAGTMIPARGFISFAQDQFGFEFNPAGQTIYFKNQAGDRVLDVVQFEGAEGGISTGRSPDGGSEFYPLEGPTPGAANGQALLNDIVINEVMYKPISGDPNDSYVELYNKGNSTIDVGGWSFVSGIKFTLPRGSMMAAGSYLVVAKSAAQLMGHYTNLNTANTVGDFSGKLSGGGERLALGKPDQVVVTNALGKISTNSFYVVVDEVTYGAGGRWGQWANAGGSSLELIDPRANHRLASNWAESDESQKSSWTNIEATGKLDLGSNYDPRIDRIQIGLLDVGECLVDNIEVVPAGSTSNYVTNPDFENGLTGWTLEGDHIQSSLESPGYESATALHLRCTDRIWTGANSAQNLLQNTSLLAGQTATLRFKARWMRGWPEVLLRLNGNWLEASGAMPVPVNLGTPGGRNSRAVDNAGPAIYEVTHSPSLPAASQAVVVTARIDDPDGLQSVTLNYRLDPSPTYISIPMSDDGSNGDAVAGDGIYSSTIDGHVANAAVAFYISAVDNMGATTRFPALLDDNSPVRECSVLFGDTIPTSGFGTYHLWLTKTNVARWSQLPDMSNESIDGTFIYGNRVIYNMMGHYSGSPYHQSFNSPLGNLCHYKWIFPEDDKFLGATSFNKIHQPGNSPGDDRALQREQTLYWIVRKLGLPWNYRRFVAVYVNGNRRGQLMEDTQVPDGDVIKERFPNDADGELFKLQPWFEFDPRGGPNYNNVSFCLFNKFTTTGGVKKVARYRWNFLSRRSPYGANNYTNVFRLIDAANLSANSPAFISAMEDQVDVEQWMRTFAASHAVGDWDHVGTENGQNMYAYKPSQGRWALLLWDCNLVLGNGSWSPGQNLLMSSGSGDRGLANIFATPLYIRALWRGLKEIAQEIMDPTAINAVLDAKYSAFVTEGITADSPASVKTWIASARSSILSQVARNGGNTNFFINSPDTVSTTQNQITLDGTAPFEVKTIAVNGSAIPLVWNTATKWTLTAPLKAGTNSIVIQGLDLQGNVVASAPNSITVIYDDPAELRILGAMLNLDGTVTVNWKSEIGKTYQIQYRDDLAQGSWMPLNDLQAASTVSSATDKASLPAQRYYRIQLLSP